MNIDLNIGAIALTALLLFAGCQSRNDTPVAEPNSVPSPNAEVAAIADADSQPDELATRDIDLYRHLLSQLGGPSPDRVYFLTMTSVDDWGEHGDWMPFPRKVTDGFANLSEYRLDTENAHLVDGTVLQKGNDSETWIQWVTIKRWIGENEAEVESGVWCCPLGGGASTKTYKKIDGKWKITDRGPSWIS